MTLVDTRTPDPKRFIPGATGDWEVIIGMEVHAQVTSNSKLDVIGSAAPVPEPETYAIMMAGLGLLGFLARRKKKPIA